MGLSGWQRLWVVLTIAWTLPVAVFVWTVWPKSPKWFEESTPLVYEVTAPDGTALEFELNRKGGQSPASGLEKTLEWHLESLVTQRVEAGEPEEKIGAFISDYSSSKKTVALRVQTPVGLVEIPRDSDVATSERAYDAMLADDVRERRMRVIGQALALWILPPAFLYALGWATGWVYRGFRPPRG